MFFRRLKLSHTRCFLPAIYFNKNIHDEIGTKDVKEKNVGGWQGVVNAFSPDEDGNPSADVRGILSTICYSTLLGGVYGSLSYSKRAYFDFFEKNQSTLFQNQFAAKSKLQTQVTLAMARGSFKWGMRVAFFCGPFATIVTIINAYKQKVSIISYGIAGSFVGGFARIHMGVKGALVGSTLGGLLGILVGSLTVLILSFTPITIDDINEWQKQNQIERDAYFIKEQKQSIVFQYDKPPELVEHEKRLQTTETVTNKS